MGKTSFLFYICFLLSSLYASETPPRSSNDHNATHNTLEPVVIDDMSGMSEEDIRKKVNTIEDEHKSLKIKDVVDAIDENGTVRVKKLVKKRWEDLSPTPKDGWDWIQTKYGDWIKGRIKGMYEDELEFDSLEFGIYIFKLKDIRQIKSFGIMSVNIDHVAIFKGLIRYKENKITIISGDNSYTFDKKMIISITRSNQEELSKWSGDITLNIDIRQGNNEKTDGSLKINLKRRTPKNRFTLDYLGRYGEVEKIKTAQDHRINLKYDLFFTKKFFITPFFGEFYQNYFQNIRSQVTLGIGVGYTIYDSKTFQWYISAGPAFLQTDFYTRTQDGVIQDQTPSLEMSTKLQYKFSSLHKVKFAYKLSLTDTDSGTYKHHSELRFENDLIKDKVYIDVSFLWDYVATPQPLADATLPKRSDYQSVVGGGIKF